MEMIEWGQLNALDLLNAGFAMAIAEYESSAAVAYLIIHADTFVLPTVLHRLLAQKMAWFQRPAKRILSIRRPPSRPPNYHHRLATRRDCAR